MSDKCLMHRRKLEEREQAWWALDLVHLLYSAAISATVLLRGRVDWLSVAAPPADADALLPDVIVCVSAGFFAFHLWALVHHRCSPVGLLRCC